LPHLGEQRNWKSEPKAWLEKKENQKKKKKKKKKKEEIKEGNLLVPMPEPDARRGRKRLKFRFSARRGVTPMRERRPQEETLNASAMQSLPQAGAVLCN